MSRRRRQRVPAERAQTSAECEAVPAADAAADPPPEADADRGLRCPDCGCGHFAVVYTRKRAQQRIVRRRQCRHCGRLVTSVEKLAP